MHQIDTANAVTVQPAVLAPGPVPDGYFQPGNPGAGQPATSFDQDWCNMVQAELAAFLAAAGVAQVKGTFNQVLASLLKTFNPELGPLPPSLAGSAPGGAKTASWTVGGELQLKTALGGQPFLIDNQVLNFNGANVGINGMDTGATPVSADLNFYAAYDPSTGAIGVFGTTQCHGPVYTGAYAPAGFTATRRISAVVTDGSGNVQLFKQSGRSIVVPSVNVLAAGTATAWTSVSLNIIVPAAAAACKGWLHSETSSGNNTETDVASDASGSGKQTSGLGAAAGNGLQTTFASLLLATAQTLWYMTAAGESTAAAINITGYEI